MAKTPKTTTAPTGNIAPFGLRMLPELKEKIEEAAKASGRSMNAEIISRLEASFSLAMDEFQNATKSETLMLQKDMEALALRQKLIVSRGDAMKASADLATMKYEKALREAKTDADFERAKREIGELDRLYEESNALAAELQDVIAQREVLVARADAIQRTLEEAAEVLDEKIRQGMLARKAGTSSGNARVKTDES